MRSASITLLKNKRAGVRMQFNSLPSSYSINILIIPPNELSAYGMDSGTFLSSCLSPDLFILDPDKWDQHLGLFWIIIWKTLHYSSRKPECQELKDYWHSVYAVNKISFYSSHIGGNWSMKVEQQHCISYGVLTVCKVDNKCWKHFLFKFLQCDSNTCKVLQIKLRLASIFV